MIYLCNIFYRVIQVFTLTVMSADRYLAVCHAIESRRYRTPGYSRLVCVAVWLTSLLAMTPIYLHSRYCDRYQRSMVCPAIRLSVLFVRSCLQHFKGAYRTT